MEHRGGSSADNISGDGSGVLTNIPWELLKDIVQPNAVKNADGSDATAVSMMFLPREQTAEAMASIENICAGIYANIVFMPNSF